jgi:hypothetical protein
MEDKKAKLVECLNLLYRNEEASEDEPSLMESLILRDE